MHRLAICVSHSYYYHKMFESTQPLPRVLEIQAIATTLIENFEFSLPPQNEKTRIYRKPSGLMIPMASPELGVWMGLIVKPID